jgi:minor histocompatibility antigen H13
VELRFDYGDLACLAVGAALGGWYLYEKHWVANNIFGLAFSVNGIEMLSLDTFMVGCYLLGGLFVYDIFWVFATDVMVTVAKSFEAPIKLLFPKDLLVNGWHSTQFTMLGLGDIVIPGIFIALMLRFDRSRAPGGQESAAGAGFARPYFLACFAAYIVGLVVTVTVMHVFRAAQPALLYLVPACLGSVTLLAVARREMPLLLAYKDTPEAEAAQAQEEPKKEL